MEELLFGVKKVKTSSILNLHLAPRSPITQAIIGNGSILHFASDDYGLMPNRDIYEAFTTLFKEKGMSYTTKGTNYGDVRFQMEFSMTDYPKSIGNKKDIVYPSIRILNSYNGTQRYTYEIRILREICSNGMTGWVNQKAIRMLHTPRVEDGVAVHKSIQLLHEFMEEYDESIEPLIALSEFNVSDINGRIEETADFVKFPKALTEQAVLRAQQEMVEFKLQPTDWVVYNALNYQLNHNADNLVGRKADTLDKEVLEYLLTY